MLTRLARTLANTSRGAAAAAVRLQVARMAKAIGEEDIQLRLAAAEQFLRSGGHVQEGQCVLDVHPLPERPLWRFLWRRVWLRVRGFGYGKRKGAKMAPRELLRMDACCAASPNELCPDFMARYQLMALRAGEPVRVGEALVLRERLRLSQEHRHPRRARRESSSSSRSWRNARRAISARARLHRSLPDRVGAGKWLHSREHSAQALQIFGERCPEAAHESASAQVGYFHFLINMGDLRDLVRELPPLLRDAEERRDRFTLATSVMAPSRSSGSSRTSTARRQIQEGMDRELWQPNQAHA